MSLRNELIGKDVTIKIEDGTTIKTFFGQILSIDSDGFLKFQYKNGRIRYFNMKYVRDTFENTGDFDGVKKEHQS